MRRYGQVVARYVRAALAMLGLAARNGDNEASGTIASRTFIAGGHEIIILSGMKRVYNLGLDSRGELYLPQFIEGTVLKLSSAGDLRAILYGPVGGWCVHLQQSPLRKHDKSDAGRRFDRPHTVTLDQDGNLYIVEYKAGRIGKFTADGELIRYLGSPSDPAVLHGPVAAWPEPDGYVYVGDARAHIVVRYCSDGTFAGWIGAGEGGDIWSGFRFDRLATVASAEPGGFNNPHLARYGPDGSLHVADTNNNRLQKFTKDGCFAGWLGWSDENTGACGWQMHGRAAPDIRTGAFASPVSFDFDADDHLYVVENANCRVQKFTAAGRAIAWFGCASDGTIGWRSGGTCVPGSEPGAFRFPYDIRVSGDRMYVSDTHNARVQIISMKSMDAAGLSGGSA